jgi:intracellular septation protein
MNTDSKTPHMNPVVKFVTEIGPLVAFFIANAKLGLIQATGVFMICVVLALAISYALTRRFAILPLVTCVFVLIFGGLTLYLNDALFIKLKPTIVNLLFAGILFGGLWFNRLFLKSVLGEVMPITDQGWHKLTVRWGLFFIFLAMLNEAVWRNFSDDFWVSFKVFGIMPLTMIFALSQISLLNRFQLGDAESD